MHSNGDINTASVYFNENWQRYQKTIESNTLFHREMLAALQQFLSENKGECPVSTLS